MSGSRHISIHSRFIKALELTGPLLVGAVAVGAGIGGLWRSRKHRQNSFQRAAGKLLADLSFPPSTQLEVSFTEDGMRLPISSDGSETVPFTSFECVVETTDVLLLVYDKRVTVLQKKDMTAGDMESLQTLLKDKVSRYGIVA